MTEIHDRVTDLENDVARTHFLARKAEREASSNTDVLRGQVGLLNALKETQREQGETLAEHGKRLDRLEHKVDAGFAQADKNFDQINKNFAQVDENFVKVGKHLGQLHAGQERITELLTEHLEKPKET
jgi:predicted  nucleic acid-binding Zn-ribbon protein